MDTRTSPEWEDSDYRAAVEASLLAFEEFEVPEPGDDLDVDAAFDSPVGDDGDVQYFVWDGRRLVPASPNKLARIHELEALDRLHALEKKQAALDASDERVRPMILSRVRLAMTRVWTLRLHRRRTHVTAPVSHPTGRD